RLERSEPFRCLSGLFKIQARLVNQSHGNCVAAFPIDWLCRTRALIVKEILPAGLRRAGWIQEKAAWLNPVRSSSLCDNDAECTNLPPERWLPSNVSSPNPAFCRLDKRRYPATQPRSADRSNR